MNSTAHVLFTLNVNHSNSTSERWLTETYFTRVLDSVIHPFSTKKRGHEIANAELKCSLHISEK